MEYPDVVMALVRLQKRYFELEDTLKESEHEKEQLLTMYNVSEQRLAEAREALDNEMTEHEKDCATYKEQVNGLTSENNQFKGKIRLLTKELAEVKTELNELQSQCEGECC
mgnify:CR=1 FL=1|jgi:chromosome segregation ATPase